MIRRWLALTYYLYALRLAALSHFYFNPLYELSETVHINQKAACTLRAGPGYASGSVRIHKPTHRQTALVMAATYQRCGN